MADNTVWVCIEVVGDKKMYTRMDSSIFHPDGLSLPLKNGYLMLDSDVYVLAMVPGPSGGAATALLTLAKYPPEKLEKPYYINGNSIVLVSRLPDGELMDHIRKQSSPIQQIQSKLIV